MDWIGLGWVHTKTNKNQRKRKRNIKSLYVYETIIIINNTNNNNKGSQRKKIENLKRKQYCTQSIIQNENENENENEKNAYHDIVITYIRVLRLQYCSCVA